MGSVEVSDGVQLETAHHDLPSPHMVLPAHLPVILGIPQRFITPVTFVSLRPRSRPRPLLSSPPFLPPRSPQGHRKRCPPAG